jgi:hypothetical protein
MRRAALIVPGLLLVATAVGCGGASHPKVGAEVMLDSAAAHPIESADTDIDLRLRVDGVPRLSGPLRLRLEGPYRSGGGERIPSFDWRLSASALGFPVGGRLVSTGDNVYLSTYGDQYEVGRPAVSSANARLASAGGLRLRVRRWLGPARVTGEDSAGGVDCERIAAPLRGEAVRRDLAPLASGLGFQAPSVSGRAVACVGYDDRVLNELQVDAVLGLSTADSARLAGATAVHVEADIVNSDVGKPKEVEAPSGPFRPIRDLFLTLEDLAGSI